LASVSQFVMALGPEVAAGSEERWCQKRLVNFWPPYSDASFVMVDAQKSVPEYIPGD
jgi:hypothetical protein